MIAFSAENDWIVLDVFHGLTDGIGAYEVIRTLLKENGVAYEIQDVKKLTLPNIKLPWSD